MKKSLITILTLLSVTCFSQNKVAFQLQSITKIDTTGIADTINLIKPKTVTIYANPLSKVVELTKVKNHIIGVQIEFLESNLQNTKHLVLGYVLYLKKSGSSTWEFISRTDHPVSGDDGNLGKKGQLISSHGFHLTDEQDEFQISYHLFIN